MFNSITIVFLTILILLILKSIKQINQYERGVRFTFGVFTGIMNPGWRLVIPIFQSYERVDIRTKAVDVPNQNAITKDNVSVEINAVIYYKVSDAARAVIEVENFRYAISNYSQTTMRNIVGEVTLDELLSSRESIASKIREIVDKETDEWGLKVNNVELKDIGLSGDMQRTIAKQAEAEREKRAVIIKSEAELASAQNLASAAHTLANSPGALHLRTLETINDLSSDQSNTVVFMMPIEILKAVEGFGKK